MYRAFVIKTNNVKRAKIKGKNNAFFLFGKTMMPFARPNALRMAVQRRQLQEINCCFKKCSPFLRVLYLSFPIAFLTRKVSF